MNRQGTNGFWVGRKGATPGLNVSGGVTGSTRGKVARCSGSTYLGCMVGADLKQSFL